MHTINDVHQQFAEFFYPESIKPYAYLVSKKLQEGHICLPVDLSAAEIESLPEQYRAYVTPFNKLKDVPFIGQHDTGKQPFVHHNSKLYLQRYFNYETIVLERIQQFVHDEKETTIERTASIKDQQSLIVQLFKKATNENAIGNTTDWQLVAAVTAVLNNFTIITGGPGTGKTTTVAKILAILYSINPKLKVALVAPTGKAAVRMAESLRAAAQQVPEQVKAIFETLEPGTIHRLLRYIPGSPYFRHNKDNPVAYDVVIVDESSMIDVALFAKLLQAIGKDTKLVLLGDKDQLASVEAGSLFGDLCNAHSTFAISSGRAALVYSLAVGSTPMLTSEFITNNPEHLLFEHIVELKQSHRFSSHKGIGKLSKAVINGDVEVLESFVHNNGDEQVQIDTTYNDKVFENFIKQYEAYIKEKDIQQALQKLNDVRVLCAIREGEQGLYAINRKIEKYLQVKKLIKPNTEFYEHRPVIITRNYYDLNLFNGDVGIIRPDEDNILKAWFEDSSGELKSILPGFISEAETLFAMTIHKSQGSEYGQVMVLLPDNAALPLLTAELLYTAVTRAKSKVVLQATGEVIVESAKRRVMRASGIIERLSETL